MTVSDCLRILDLPGNACLEDLKIAYRNKAKKYHPDRVGGDTRKFTILHEAYTFLLDYKTFNRRTIDREAEERSRNERFRRAAEERLKRDAAQRASREKAMREAEEKSEREKKRKVMEKKAEERKAAYEKSCYNAELKAAKERAHKLAEKKNTGSHKVCSAGELLSKSFSEKEKLSAINTLISLKRKSAYPFLRKAFYDRSETVVSAAIRAIGMLRIIQAGPELGSLLTTGSRNIKIAILDTLSMIGNKNYYRDIISIALIDRDILIRQKADAIYKRIYE